MLSEKKISVVILTYNSKTLIKDCLHSVFLYNDIADSLEVIVVDNNSVECESMFEWIKDTYGDSVLLIKNCQNGGYGQGNNIGVQAASSPIVLIMNPDVRLLNPMFSKVCDIYEKDANVAIVGMKQLIDGTSCAPSINLLMDDNSNLYPIYGLFSVFFTLFANKLINYFDLYNSEKMFIHGSCFFIRKDYFIEAGLFDENIFMYCEEKDWHRRLFSLNKPLKNIYLKSICYKHLIGERKIHFNGCKVYLESEIYYARKHSLSVRNILYYNLYRYYILKLIAKMKRVDVYEYDKVIEEIRKEKEAYE